MNISDGLFVIVGQNDFLLFQPNPYHTFLKYPINYHTMDQFSIRWVLSFYSSDDVVVASELWHVLFFLSVLNFMDNLDDLGMGTFLHISLI